MPVLSTRNSTLPALISLTACVTFGVTVPVLGFGIRPRGPSTFPSLPTTRIMSGVATTASKSSQPPAILSTISSPPTESAPASVGFLLLVGRRQSPARASTCPGHAAARRCRAPSDRRASDRRPAESTSATVSSNLANLIFCTSGSASSSAYGRFSTCCSRRCIFLAVFLHVASVGRRRLTAPPTGPRHRSLRTKNQGLRALSFVLSSLVLRSSSSSADHVYAHRPRGAGDRLDGGFDRAGS